jgi:hypothetical protein
MYSLMLLCIDSRYGSPLNAPPVILHTSLPYLVSPEIFCPSWSPTGFSERFASENFKAI